MTRDQSLLLDRRDDAREALTRLSGLVGPARAEAFRKAETALSTLSLAVWFVRQGAPVSAGNLVPFELGRAYRPGPDVGRSMRRIG